MTEMTSVGSAAFCAFFKLQWFQSKWHTYSVFYQTTESGQTTVVWTVLKDSCSTLRRLFHDHRGGTRGGIFRPLRLLEGAEKTSASDCPVDPKGRQAGSCTHWVCTEGAWTNLEHPPTVRKDDQPNSRHSFADPSTLCGRSGHGDAFGVLDGDQDHCSQ